MRLSSGTTIVGANNEKFDHKKLNTDIDPFVDEILATYRQLIGDAEKQGRIKLPKEDKERENLTRESPPERPQEEAQPQILSGDIVIGSSSSFSETVGSTGEDK